jgi:hypothetical protein
VPSQRYALPDEGHNEKTTTNTQHYGDWELNNRKNTMHILLLIIIGWLVWGFIRGIRKNVRIRDTAICMMANEEEIVRRMDELNVAVGACVYQDERVDVINHQLPRLLEITFAMEPAKARRFTAKYADKFAREWLSNPCNPRGMREAIDSLKREIQRAI